MSKFKRGDFVEIIKPGIIGFGSRGKVLGLVPFNPRNSGQFLLNGDADLVRVELHVYDMDMEVDYSEDCIKKIAYRSIDEEWEDGTECTQSSGPDVASVPSDVQ